MHVDFRNGGQTMRYRHNTPPDEPADRPNRDRHSNSGYPGGGESYTQDHDPYGRRYDDPAGGAHARRETRERYARRDSWTDDPQWRGQGAGQGDFPGRSGLSFPYQSQPRTPVYPKGYVRSDEYIHDDLCERLSRSGLEVADVEVAVSAGKAVLTGNVPARWIKHAVEDAAVETRGVTEVENRIRVAAKADARSA
ncbi:BON domain-containing protein [Bordetella petrii]|uniref:BON domain-containing protein n=1 Tax=Bordetella petrii TaxID=94624 RepID=UPI0004BB5AC7|nr:BON domain-containing protein [Bordetella petrii]